LVVRTFVECVGRRAEGRVGLFDDQAALVPSIVCEFRPSGGLRDVATASFLEHNRTPERFA
jgi:hypothetical protein